MAVWTIKINIIGKPDAFKFCMENNLVGFGWGLPEDGCHNFEIKTIQDYKNAKEDYEPYRNSTHLTACINYFESMNKEDLIWTMDSSTNTYYLCEITGEYKYLKKEYSDKYGIVNCMKVYSYNLISENLVPPEVKRLLHSQGLVYRVDDERNIAASLYKIIKDIDS